MAGYTTEDMAAMWEERALEDQKRVWALEDTIEISKEVLEDLE
jgi:hypothetical protein